MYFRLIFLASEEKKAYAPKLPLKSSAYVLRPNLEVEDPSQLEKQKNIQALTVWEGFLPRRFFKRKSDQPEVIKLPI